MSDELAIVYVLLDWGGNVEDEKIMTPTEAKELNAKLLEGERLLRWAPKKPFTLSVCGHQP